MGDCGGLDSAPVPSVPYRYSGSIPARERHTAAHVDVLGHAGPLVAEVVGDLPRAGAGLVEPGRDRAPEGVRHDPVAVGYDRLRHRERAALTNDDIESIRFVLRQMIDLG